MKITYCCMHCDWEEKMDSKLEAYYLHEVERPNCSSLIKNKEYIKNV